ncbi:MAG: DUF370 domain-containing protein [Firmicutes bacterium]|nr:DUF370 domain-containing protein [Alicyclobacillaceae bacterium]MCL6496117.1 DUF370 domain-containing protein [Bacillota bacterium]
MYLHIGHDVTVPQGEVIAIIDRELLRRSPETRQWFNRLRGLGQIFGDEREAKSLVIVPNGVYCSPISAVTLMRRAQSRALQDE